MDGFIHSQNIVNFADRLESECDPIQRATLMKLLVEEEDRLGRRMEQLDLANRRIASSRELVAKQQSLIARLALAGQDTNQANMLLTRLLEVQALFESYRDKILDGLNG